MLELKSNLNKNKNKAYTTLEGKKQYKKVYNIKSKETMNLYKNTKNNCGSYSTKHKAKHLKTNKHKQHEQNIINNITNNYNITNLTINNK